jgi:hypothetical protein
MTLPGQLSAVLNDNHVTGGAKSKPAPHRDVLHAVSGGGRRNRVER